MLMHILTRTPVYVWAILAFLVYRGVLASRTREVPVRKLFIIPVLMLALSLQGLVNGFGPQAGVLALWLAALGASALVAWRRVDAAAIVIQPERDSIVKQGNWSTLALLMAIFLLKYAVAVALAIKPALAADAVFAFGAAALFGVFNGVFIGDALRHLAAYRDSVRAVAAQVV